MAEPLVTVLLPSLNVAPYIEECLTSVEQQTLKNIEILCIDAGSTDGTRDVLAAHAACDGRIRILDSDKRSVGYQMNLGLQAARGRYIGILETDDYVAPEMYATLCEAAERTQADIVRMDFEVFWGRGEERQFLPKPVAAAAQYGRLLRPRDEQAIFYNDMSIWAGMYRRDFLQTYQIRENETPGAAYQDTGFWFQTYACADRLLYLAGSEHGYRYRLDNPASSVHSRQQAFVICDEFDFLRQALERHGCFDELRDTYHAIQCNRYLWNYLRLDKIDQRRFAQRFAQDMRAAGDFPLPESEQSLLRELLASPETFHAHRQQEREALDHLLAGTRPIVLFGCGSDGLRLLGHLRAQGQLGRIACLTDNNQALHDAELFGKPILSPAEARARHPQAAYLIASSNHGGEIEAQLREMGVVRENIWMGHVC